MFSKFSLPIYLISLSLITISACKKTDVGQTELAAAATQKQPQVQLNGTNKNDKSKRVYISNIEQLYASINDPANEGSTLVLAAGTYQLKSNYPKAGRLELQHNMSLIGQSGDASAVVIDVSSLPPTSYAIVLSDRSVLRTGPIRMGNGYNAIEWITFTNSISNELRSMIQTDIVAKQNASVAAPLAQVRIAHTVIKNSSIGLNILNRDAASDGRVLEAEIENNEIFDNTQPLFGSGVQIQNSQGVSGAVIKVTLRGNYIHGNRQGLNMFNSSRRGNNKIIARSISDRLEDNGLGLVLSAGLNSVEGPAKIIGNMIDFEANATLIRDNDGVPAPLSNYIPGGVFIGGGVVGKLALSTGVAGTVISNTVTAVFKGCRIEDNVGSSQINVFGAYSSLPFPLPAGINNSAVLTLIGVSKKATVHAVASFPVEPAGTNTVTVQQ